MTPLPPACRGSRGMPLTSLAGQAASSRKQVGLVGCTRRPMLPHAAQTASSQLLTKCRRKSALPTLSQIVPLFLPTCSCLQAQLCQRHSQRAFPLQTRPRAPPPVASCLAWPCRQAGQVAWCSKPTNTLHACLGRLSAHLALLSALPSLWCIRTEGFWYVPAAPRRAARHERHAPLHQLPPQGHQAAAGGGAGGGGPPQVDGRGGADQGGWRGSALCVGE